MRHPELVSGSRFCLYVTLNLFQSLVFEMLNQVQHDEVVVASPKTPPLRHPEHHFCVTLNLFQGLSFHPYRFRVSFFSLRHPEFISESRFFLCVTLNLFQGLLLKTPRC